jgi:acetyltransferase-like isoleucine patch superfamily enzyme
VNPGVTIGDHAIINTGATVDHDCVLARDVQIGPGAHLGGGVRCESRVFIGLGASLVQGVTIGEAAIVGAGSVVLANVPSGSTVVGNPARALRDVR